MAMDYAHAIRHFFNESGMSQAELCRRGGFSRAYVSMLLSGKVNNPKWDRACQIADALGVTLEDFRNLMEDRGNVGQE
jgi:transcriptional regulator with XRE-family HTH domain